MRWRILLAVILCCAFSVKAQLRTFVADIDTAQWQLSLNNPLSCQLIHDIPAYGKAIFTSQANKKSNLNFTLDMWVKPSKLTKVQLQSMAPKWRPGTVGQVLAELDFYPSFNGELLDGLAWSMLAQLNSGMQPTFSYLDWYNKQDRVSVGLSSANFKSTYESFRACVSQLLPYSFEDIAFTVLSYRSGSDQLTDMAQHQLARVNAYLAVDPSVELVLIDAYSDSYGSRQYNQTLSQDRADSLKAILVASGIDNDRIVTFAHGEKRQVASNRSIEERDKNRRVVIKIIKS
ncbi:OmpA family protein [uncultured Shewanella sp.]|uniref:flagellar protein MotY n=1 Tax=uncultured Shewanella sp. TaxID=173975 RepID=UPI002613030D|nr:OmpA family protein [uncultured Shewanella sp.]